MKNQFEKKGKSHRWAEGQRASDCLVSAGTQASTYFRLFPLPYVKVTPFRRKESKQLLLCRCMFCLREISQKGPKVPVCNDKRKWERLGLICLHH